MYDLRERARPVLFEALFQSGDFIPDSIGQKSAPEKRTKKRTEKGPKIFGPFFNGIELPPLFPHCIAGVTIMLSITIFATIVGEMLPVSDATPLIGLQIDEKCNGLFCTPHLILLKSSIREQSCRDKIDNSAQSYD